MELPANCDPVTGGTWNVQIGGSRGPITSLRAGEPATSHVHHPQADSRWLLAGSQELWQVWRQRLIHIQCSYPSRRIVKIITLYQPDPEQWIDYVVRRK